MSSKPTMEDILTEDMQHITSLITEQECDPFVVLGAKLSNVLVMYKTLMVPSEYDQMMEHIASSKDRIPTLKEFPPHLKSTGIH